MANLEELKARLVAAIEANKAENKRFEPVKILQAAAEKFKTAQDKAAAKKELQEAFLAVKNANFILPKPLQVIFDQCSKVFGATKKEEEITKTKIIICRHIVTYQNMDCNTYTQMSIVLGQQAKGSPDDVTHHIHLNPPFDVERYTWAANSKSWIPETDPQFSPAKETITSFSNPIENILYKQFEKELANNLDDYMTAYEKVGGQKYPLMTANSLLWKVNHVNNCGLAATNFSISATEFDAQKYLVFSDAGTRILERNITQAAAFFANTRSVSLEMTIFVPAGFPADRIKVIVEKEIKKQFERLPTTQQLGMPPFNIKTDIIRGATTIDIFWDNFSE